MTGWWGQNKGSIPILVWGGRRRGPRVQEEELCFASFIRNKKLWLVWSLYKTEKAVYLFSEKESTFPKI